MKKIALTCFALITVFSVSACSTGQYKYKSYRRMLEKKEFNPEETKATAKINLNGVESEISYEYDAENSKRWVGTYKEIIDNEEIEMTAYQTLNVKAFVSTLPGMAAMMKQEVDDVYKFYFSKGEYRITAEVLDEDGLKTGESLFNKDGLCTYSYSLIKNKIGEVIEEETINYTYSK